MDITPSLSEEIVNIAKYALEPEPASEVMISGTPSSFKSAIFIS